jgi:general secretion pathway protein K
MILVTVLWIVFVLSLISLSLAASVRVEVASTQQSFDSEKAFYMAKGAAEAVYNAYSKKQDIPEGTPIRRENGQYIFPFDSGEARVQFESKVGFIDLNEASDQLLGSMFDSLGLPEETRNRLVDCILDWRDEDDIPHLYGAEVNDYPENSPGHISRPANGPFQSVDELLLVKNMTPEIFYGSFNVQTATGQYQRVPGVRELVTVNSGSGLVDVNEASPDVLRAVPKMKPDVAQQIVAERMKQRIDSMQDLAQRIPELMNSETIKYLSADPQTPSILVSRATVSSSGISRTVRLLFKRQEKTQILYLAPLIVRKTMESSFDRWRFD